MNTLTQLVPYTPVKFTPTGRGVKVEVPPYREVWQAQNDGAGAYWLNVVTGEISETRP